MRIIDLLYKIANGETDKLPKTIKYKGHIFKLGITQYNYFDETEEYTIFEYIRGQNLTDEVEILETTITYNQDNIENNKQDKIEKCIRRIISNNFCITDNNYKERFEVIRKSIENNAKEIEYTKAKINEIIDKVNEL